MTFLEKAKELDYSETDVIHKKCPSALGLEEPLSCCDMNCAKCWIREMPGTEPKPFTREEIYKEDYNKGLNDAWELALKTYRMNCDRRKEILGQLTYDETLESLFPQEALAKLKAYEEAQSKIEVGDIVQYKSIQNEWIDVLCTAIIKSKDDGYEDTLQGIRADGTHIYNAISGFRKTGKHIDIQSILSQIGGE